MNKVSIKNLLPGESFTLTGSTVMTVVGTPRTGGGKTLVAYRLPDSERVYEFVRASLTTATIVSN